MAQLPVDFNDSISYFRIMRYFRLLKEIINLQCNFCNANYLM